jgi:hypothetical protein
VVCFTVILPADFGLSHAESLFRKDLQQAVNTSRHVIIPLSQVSLYRMRLTSHYKQVLNAVPEPPLPGNIRWLPAYDGAVLQDARNTILQLIS